MLNIHNIHVVIYIYIYNDHSNTNTNSYYYSSLRRVFRLKGLAARQGGRPWPSPERPLPRRWSSYYIYIYIYIYICIHIWIHTHMYTGVSTRETRRTPCGGEVLHVCLQMSRTKCPIEHHVAPHRRCRLFVHVSRETADVTPLSHLTAAGCRRYTGTEICGWHHRPACTEIRECSLRGTSCTETASKDRGSKCSSKAKLRHRRVFLSTWTQGAL